MQDAIDQLIAHVVAKCVMARRNGLTPICDTCKQAFLGDDPETVLIMALEHYGLLGEVVNVTVVDGISPQAPHPFSPKIDKSSLN